MKETISIQICTGTTCYVMGASDLLTLEDHIPADIAPFVRISGSTCLSLCKQKTGNDDTEGEKLKPPFVKVCGRVISQATIDKILKAVRAEMEGDRYAYDE